MELRYFRYFVAAAEEENVTRAAARLHLSQPSLSRQIRDLEEELDLALFERGPRSVRLTEAGRVFLAEARAVLQRVDEAVVTAKAVAGGKHGEIHVGFAPSLTVEILPDALRRFQQSNAGVQVRLHDLSTQEMLDSLREKELHTALMIQPPAKARKGLVFEELRRYAVCVAAHPSHPLARAETARLEDVAKDRLIAYDAAEYPEYHAWLSELFARVKRSPQIAEEHDGSTGLVAAVEAGRGVALVQEGFECFSGPRLAIRPLQPAPPPLVIGIAYREEIESAAAKQFIASVRMGIPNR